jgi:two-component system cell cycle response regulator
VQGASAEHREAAAPPTGLPSRANGPTSLLDGADRRVLIAEDDAFLRQILGVTLRSAGYQVVEAEDGARAWELLQQDHVPMVIADWSMPGMDGTDLVRRIRSAEWPAYTYIVMLTVRSEKSDVVEGLNSGADDYLSKPFHQEELLARMGVGNRILDLETRLHSMVARERGLAATDGLTGLLNRRGLYERARSELSRSLREGTDIGFVMMDLDDFKGFNDAFGHIAGDRALCLISDALRQELRDYDFAGRWGGEEFVVVLPGASLVQAARAAERIRASVASVSVPVEGRNALPLELSLGVASCSGRDGDVTLDAVLEKADDALYRAKAAGGNQVRVHQAGTEDCHPGQWAGEA